MDSIVYWDDPDDPKGNVQHIVRHHLTTEEVEAILLDPNSQTSKSRSSGRPITFGYLPDGAHVAIIWQTLRDDPHVIYPVTAFFIR